MAGKIGEGNWARRTRWSLAGAAAWVALEMVRVRLFGGFPWALLGVSQYQMVPLIQIASVTGVYGISFLVTWFSLSLFSALRAIFGNPNRRFVWQAEIILPLLTVMGLFIFGYARVGQGNSSGNHPARDARPAEHSPNIDLESERGRKTVSTIDSIDGSGAGGKHQSRAAGTGDPDRCPFEPG